MVAQVTLGQGVPLDPVLLCGDALAAAAGEVGGREVAQAFVGADVVAGLDKGSDLLLQGAGQAAVLEQDAVLERLVPALGLALGLRMPWGASNVGCALVREPLGRIARDVARAVVAQQPWPVPNLHPIQP